ncbi:substrate-binding domain-containing protein [Ruoffia tabacinasalis]|uniref:sugar ABC transporter substrate-binding protein n=1 Tax=Ruoffia tabacinasalis TaxID=87458 RepID=UPI003F94626C
MKKFKLVIMGLISLLILSACTTESNTTTSDNSPSDSKKIVFSITHMSNAFTVELSDAVKQKGEELGYTVEVVSADQDSGKQNNQIETAVTQEVAGIIVEPVSVDGVVPAAQSAKDAGIPIVIVNQQISDPSAADSYVGADAIESGEILMRQVLSDIGETGNVGLILGPMGSDGQVGRSTGFSNIMEGTDIKVSFENTADWDTDKALRLTENWIQSDSELKAIIAQNDNMALGAQKAIEDAKKEEDILTYGIDATPDGLQAVKDGRLAATVSQGTTEQGLKAVEVLDQVINGQEVEEVNIINCILITKDNVDEFLN